MERKRQFAIHAILLWTLMFRVIQAEKSWNSCKVIHSVQQSMRRKQNAQKINIYQWSFRMGFVAFAVTQFWGVRDCWYALKLMGKCFALRFDESFVLRKLCEKIRETDKKNEKVILKSSTMFYCVICSPFAGNFKWNFYKSMTGHH